jgi:HEAT repeat protein
MSRLCATLALIGSLMMVACGPRAAPPAPPLTTEREAPDLVTMYAGLLDELLPGMGAAEVTDRAAAQQEFERICLQVGMPSAVDKRVALCQAMLPHLGPGTARPARVWLLRQLERIGGGESVTRLGELLRDDDPEVRELARRALQGNSSPAATLVLCEALQQATDPVWQVALLNALADSGEHALNCWPIIWSRAESADPAVRAAVIALQPEWPTDGRTVDWVQQRARSADPAEQEQAVAALLRIAEQQVAAGQTEAASRLYMELCQSALPARLQLAALCGLVMAAPQSSVSQVSSVVCGGLDASVRASAVRLLGEIPGPRATRELVRVLSGVSPELQVIVLDVLAERGDAHAKPAVIKALDSTDTAVRVAALDALRQLGDASDIARLATVAATTGGREQDAARAALARLRGFAVDPALTAGLDQEVDEGVRAELIRSLAARRFALAVPRLLSAARDPSATVRAASFAALGELVAETDLPKLLALLVAEQEEDAAQAAEDAVVAVCQRDHERERRVTPVTTALSRAVGAAAVPLIRVLGRLQGTTALTAVSTALDAPEAVVRDAAVRALAAWDDPAALDELARLARDADDEAHYVLALRGYVRLVRQAADRSPEQTLVLLESARLLARRLDEQRLVLGALGEIVDLAALDAIMSDHWDAELAPEVGAAAVSVARGLAGRHPERAGAVLEELRGQVEVVGADVAAQAAAALVLLDERRHDIGVWRCAGPFSVAGQRYADVFETAFAPESEPAGADWRLLTASRPNDPWTFEVDRRSACSNCCMYAETAVWSEATQPARLAVGSDDGVKVWLNGTLVHSNPVQRGLVPGEDLVDITLQQGWNRLVLKVVNGSGGWGFSCGVRPAGGRELAPLRFEVQ